MQLVAPVPGLALAAAAVPKGVICLLSALAFHGIGTQTPDAVWIALRRGAWRPRPDYPPLRVARFNEAAFAAGMGHHAIEGQTVAIYGLAKTLADCFKFRNKIGLDVALEALHFTFREVCDVNVEPDGMRFDSDSVGVNPIREQDAYGGQRVTLIGHLGSARLTVQVDVGIGDAVSPVPEWLEYPSLLGLPAPRLLAYQPETSIAASRRCGIKGSSLRPGPTFLHPFLTL